MAEPVKLAGWGRYPVAECILSEPADTAAAATLAAATSGTLIARGNGRSYGDSSLNREEVIGTRALNRLLAFDEQTGLLTCEAGTMLSDLLDTLLPRGWFPPVTPGTKLVTVGGMIASDVHGKNHHGAGSFCDHVAWLDLLLAEGSVVRCSRDQYSDLFAATCGGMGLTGVILRASFRMTRVETSRIRQHTVRAPNLAAAMDVFERSQRVTYSVAWIDCLATGSDLGRSVVFLGEHAKLEDLPAKDRGDPFRRPAKRSKKVPVDFPGIALSKLSVKAFNALYYRAQKPGDALVDLEPYFYPLDAILEWNRIYGRHGFVQYQCVLPPEESRAGLERLLGEIAAAGSASFLAVLKQMGAQSFGLLSFPMPGYTLALDFAATAKNLALLDRLDGIVAEHGGRLYLAKDARMSAQMLERGYPRLERLLAARAQLPRGRDFASLQSRRLEIA